MEDRNSVNESSDEMDVSEKQQSSATNLQSQECKVAVETATHSNVPMDTLTSPNKRSGEQRKRLSDSDMWFVVPTDSPDKDPESLKLRLRSASSPNRKRASNTPTKDDEPCVKLKTQQLSSVSTEDTQFASIMKYSATETQMLESSQSMSMIQNLYLSSPRHFPELNSPDSDEERTDRNRPESSTRTSELNEKSLSELKEPPISSPEAVRKSEEVLTSRKSPETQEQRDQCNPPTRSQPIEISSLPEIPEDFRRTTWSGQSIFQGILPGSSNMTSASRNPQEFLGQPDQSSTRMAETLSSNEPAAETDNQEMPVEGSGYDPLLQQNRAISSDALISRKCSGLDRDADSSVTDAAKGRVSSPSNEPRVEGGSSAGDQSSSSSCVNLFGKGPAIRFSSAAGRPSRLVFQAQMLLLAVLEKIMELDEDRWRFEHAFHLISKRSSILDEMRLNLDLSWYSQQRIIAWNAQYLFAEPLQVTLEFLARLRYETLIKIVIKSLILTVTILDFDAVITVYVMLRKTYDECSELWNNNNVEDVEDEVSRSRVATLKELTQTLLLNTKNAFQILLMHVGGHAEQEKLDEYEEKLDEEDKKYLRRKI